MYVIEARNVNGVYAELLRLIRKDGQRSGSRAGEVLALPAPCVLITHRPIERVLLDPGRDANPFFHLFESLFLLAGRDDYTWLDRFVRDFSARFAEPDGRGHGSYGRRWRSHFGFDQLDLTVAKLREDPHDRRVVIQMWDGLAHTHQTNWTEYGVDAEWGADDLRADKRDVPCNTHVYPRIVDSRLDLTVCCRSNDAVWGAAGANAVQFSVLLEYLAGKIGVAPGRLYQLANNMHAYTARLTRYGEPSYNRWEGDPYNGPWIPTPIGTDWTKWDADLRVFMDCCDGRSDWLDVPPFFNEWFKKVAWQMWDAHKIFANGAKSTALQQCSYIEAPDWRLACENWIKRRMK